MLLRRSMIFRKQVLGSEVEQLQSCISEARTAKSTQLEDILALALNSLQRLHAGHSDHPESDDEAEAMEAGTGGLDGEDDDEDPFFMPMPGAIKWAEASKFKELAKPLAPEQPAERQFMIVMEDGKRGLAWDALGARREAKARLVHGCLRNGHLQALASARG